VSECEVGTHAWEYVGSENAYEDNDIVWYDLFRCQICDCEEYEIVETEDIDES